MTTRWRHASEAEKQDYLRTNPHKLTPEKLERIRSGQTILTLPVEATEFAPPPGVTTPTRAQVPTAKAAPTSRDPYAPAGTELALRIERRANGGRSLAEIVSNPSTQEDDHA